VGDNLRADLPMITKTARMVDRVRLLGINTLALSAVDAPFGGVKESGHGSEDGPEGLDAFLVTKTVHQG
jgi:acyl-CoA reductase-like NAD-dependent aldehyde dehydrogenase